MEAGRLATVLFADVSGSTKLYETAGDAVAHQAIGRCVESLKKATEAGGGRVIKTIGDEIMSVFATADAAGGAAAEMQAAMERLPAVGGTKLGVKIGFHCGPVIQQDNDVFGDTVNLAARLVEQAVKGQILTSADTVDQLGPLFRAWTRTLYPIEVKGKAEKVVLCELLWNQQSDATSVAGGRPTVRPVASVLRLKYGERELSRRRESDSVTLGREEGCDLVVNDDKASRKHCTIERRQDKWVLKDHSTNGTFVTIDGDSEILLQREELTLRKRGWICCGNTRGETSHVVEYSCE
jgi:adenylate cyclase